MVTCATWEDTVFASNRTRPARWPLLITLIASVILIDDSVSGVDMYLHATLLASVATISRLGVTDSLLGTKPRLGCAPGCVLNLRLV